MGVEIEDLERFLFDDWNEDAGQQNGTFETNAPNRHFVKDSLKSKILKRRQSLGLDVITVDFSPKQHYPMTEKEKEKDRKRKESNRISAKKCREKQKEIYESNKKLLKQLRIDQEALYSKLKETEEEKNKVLFALKNILPDCYIIETLKQIKINTFSENTKPTNYPESIEQNNMFAELDTINTTNERNMFEKERFGSYGSESSLVSIQDDEEQTVDSVEDVEIEDDILLSLFTQ